MTKKRLLVFYEFFFIILKKTERRFDKYPPLERRVSPTLNPVCPPVRRSLQRGGRLNYPHHDGIPRRGTE